MAVQTATTTVVRTPMAPSIGLLLARLPLGVYFILAGIMKFTMKPNGVSTFIDSTMPAATRLMSDNLAHTFLGALPYAEIALGAFLIMGLVTRVIAACMALLLIAIMIGETGLMAGQGSILLHPNLVFLGTALALVFCGGGWISVDGLLFGQRVRRDREILAADEASMGGGSGGRIVTP